MHRKITEDYKMKYLEWLSLEHARGKSFFFLCAFLHFLSFLQLYCINFITRNYISFKENIYTLASHNFISKILVLEKKPTLTLVSLNQQFSLRRTVSPRGAGNAGAFLVVTLGDGSAAGIQWIKARDAAKDPIMHRMVHTAKTDSGLKCQQRCG